MTAAESAKAAHRLILEKAGETSERIRAVGVVTKSARNAFREGGDAVETLLGTAGEVVSAVECLLSAARERGLQTMDGLGMLIHQGARSFELWFGIKPDAAKARERLVAALSA